MERHDLRQVEAVAVLSGELWADSVQRIVDAWQKILRLEDWDIEIAIVRESESESQGSLAYIATKGNAKTARLTLINPIDWAQKQVSGKEIEDTLVHELVHLYFREAGIEYADNEEHVVECATRALMSLRDLAESERND